METCKFTFDCGPEWEGFSHGSTWNGFDNVAVTKETLEAIKAHFRSEEFDNEVDETFGEITPMESGLYSLGWGFATQIVSE